MTDAITSSGTKTTLSTQELNYLRSFLEAGDRGGFYMAYYSLVGADDPLSLFSESDVGKLEASLQTKVATFSGGIGATAYLTNRLLEERYPQSTYPGIYFISQKVAYSGYLGLEDSLNNGDTGLISDDRFFQTATQTWTDLNIADIFPGLLLGDSADDAALNTLGSLLAYLAWLGDQLVANGGTLPDRQANLNWITSGGLQAAGLTTIYVIFRDIAGKTVSDYSGMAGYEVIETADGNQTFVVNSEGHVVAGEADVPSNGSSQYENFDALGRLILDLIAAAGDLFSPVLEAAGIVSIQSLMAYLDPVFAPHIPSDWTDLTYPVGEERVSNIANSPTPTAFRRDATEGNDTLVGTGTLAGWGGGDVIDGGGGNDAIFGGGGKDKLTGGAGDDILWGQEQDDELIGGAGDDVLRGGSGDDILKAGLGIDIIDGGAPDIEIADAGTDTADYRDLGALQEIRFTLGGDNQAEVDGGVFYALDEDGQDTLISIERVFGTNHADSLTVKNNGTALFDGIEWIDLGDHSGPLENGQRPIDSLNVAELDAPVTVDLRNADDQLLVYHGDGAELHLRNIEGIVGTRFSDMLYGIAENDAYGAGSEILAGEGHDTIYGGKGLDRLVGGDGVDWVEGGDGNDILYSADKDSVGDDGDADTLIGGKGADRYFLDGSDDLIIDTDFEDGESVTFVTIVLTGGKSTKEQPDIYIGEDGTRYEYETGADGQPVLKITHSNGAVAYIQQFVNGEAGIHLTQEPDEDDPLDPERFLSPLVLDLDGDGIELTDLGSGQSYFDFGGDGFAEMTGWVAADDGLLAWDRNGNGQIDDVSELFGSNPVDFEELENQPGGMARLSQLDANFDGIISASDLAFGSLVVWQDANGDGEAQDGELVSLDALNIESINLDYFRVSEAAGDSIITERSAYTRADGTTGEVADVWFRTRPAAAQFDRPAADSDILDLPYIGGSGMVRDLHSAMQLDPLLEEMVRELASLAPEDAWQAAQKVEAILLRWTGADEVRADSRGPWFDARYLTALERWSGDKFVQLAWENSSNPYPQASAALMKNYRELVATITVKLLAQTDVGATLLPELGYFMDAFLVLDSEFSASGFAARAAANSPADAYQQIVYWHGIVRAAEGLADGTGLDVEVLADAIDTALAGINPQLSFDALHRMILGSDGDDQLIGTSNELNDEFGSTDPANWTLPDLGGIDWLVGGAGDDRLAGGYGRDTYVFGRGFGRDTVYDNFAGQYDGSGDQDDVVQLIGDLTLADIQLALVTVEGRQVARLTIAGSDDMLDFELANRSSDGRPRREQVRIVASDGTAADYDLRTGELVTIGLGLTLSELQFSRIIHTFALEVKAPDGTLLAVIPDYFSSTREDAIAFSLNGAAVTYQQVDIERLQRAQTAGNDRIEDTPRSNLITGLAGNDGINAGKGDDVIDGGAGADVLRGDRGTDTYLFGRGSGVDTIIDPFGLNVVEFGENIVLTDLQLSYGPNGTDLVIRIAGTQDQLVVMGAFGKEDGGVETFRFAGGATMNRDQIQALLPAPSDTTTGLLNQGTDGVDTIGALGPFTVAAGLGGRDIYRFNRGDGVMVIGDTDLDDWNWDTDGPFPNGDIIQFGAGITPDDLELRLVAPYYDYYQLARENSIEITIKGTSDVIQVHAFSPYWYYYGPGDDPSHRTTAIDELRFADGQVMNLDAIFAELEKGTDGDDIIRAFFEGTVLDGGHGNDMVSPGDGGAVIDDVTIRFGRSSGQDETGLLGYYTGSNHTILFDSDIDPEDLIISAVWTSPGDWISSGFSIGIQGEDDSLLVNWAATGAFFEFGDGTRYDMWDFARLGVQQATLTSGDAIQLFGYAWNWTPAQQVQNAQTVVMREGMGTREILWGAAGAVNIQLPDGVSFDDLQFTPEGTANNVKIRVSIGDSDDALILSNVGQMYSGTTPGFVRQVRIFDSTGAMITNQQIIDNTAAVTGDSGSNLLVGTAGNDLINGGGGVDTVLFGHGSGQDIIGVLAAFTAVPGSYRIKLGANTSFDELTLTFDPQTGTAVIGIAGSEDSLTLNWHQLVEIEAADGAISTPADLVRQAAQEFDRETGEIIRLPYFTLPSGQRIEVGAGGGDDDVTLPAYADLVFRRGDGHDQINVDRIVFADVQSMAELEFSWEERTWQYYDDEFGPPITEDGNVEAFYTITIRDTGDSVTFNEDFWPDIFLADGTQVFADTADLIGQATNGDDVLTGLSWWDIEFDGLGGNDTLNGYLGWTIYHFGHGDGTDTLIENGSWFDWDWDVIQFKEGVDPDEVTVSVDAEGNLVVEIAGTDDKMIIPSLKQRIFEPGIEEILFHDGTSWLINDILPGLMVATSGDDVMFDRYGDRKVPDRYTQNNSNLMDGGAGNDFLAGGAGNDFYVFGLGYGHDTIMDKSPVGLSYELYHVEDWWDSYPALETDTLTFLPGVMPEDLEFLRGGRTGNDLIIRIWGTEDQITIVDQFAPLDFTGDRIFGEYEFELQLEDANGNGMIDPHEIPYVPLRYLASTPNGIEAIRFSNQQVLTTADIAGLVEGTDNSGDNEYWTDDNGGTLDGGEGNDVLTGGTANDDFVFERGYGEDEIRDTGGYDIVNFGTGVRQSYLHFSRVGEDQEDLLVEVDGPERLTLTIDGQFAQAPGVVEEFTFLTGEYLTWIDVQNIILEEARSSGDDDILGFLTADIVDGGDGNDVLEGWKGDDTIIGGEGRDVAVFSGSRADYLVEEIDGAVRVTDLRAGMDGIDTLYGIEELKFQGGAGSTEILVEANRDPVATDGSFSTAEEMQLVIARSSLLALVSDPDGNALEILGVADAAGGRAWINLAGDIVFDPAADFFGNGGFDFTISDGHGGSVTARAVIAVSNSQDAPRLTGVMQEVATYEDMPVDVAIPAGLFHDPDGDPLAISATMVDGSPLPPWLSLVDGRLAGTPPADFNGSLDLLVSASDGQESVTTQLFLAILPVNDGPVLTSPLADVHVERGEEIDIPLPAGLFSDVDGDSLELAVRLEDGSVLPAWLTFDGQRLTGTVPADFDGELQVEVFASDGEALVSDVFAILGNANLPPVVGQPIGDLQFSEDQPFTYTLPANLFNDPDADPLALSLTLADGSPLPGWVIFDGTTISGQAPLDFNGSLQLRLSASDGEFTAFQQFGLQIQPVNDAPYLAQALEDRHSAEDAPIDFLIPASTFTDVDNGSLSLSARLVGGEALPQWLSFADGRFTGTPPANFNGFVDIEVIASDGQASAQDVFRLVIDPLNDPPISAVPIPDATVAEGQAIAISIDPAAFSDADGDQLTYSATLANGAALPAWLSFQNGQFTGAVPYDASGSYEIRVTASDGSSTASDTFLLTVTNTNRPPVAANDGLFVTLRAEALLIMASDLLANDSDPDGNPLSIVSVTGATQGTVALNAEGNIIYTPDGGYMGTDSFTYVLSDGTTTATAQVSIQVDDPFATWSLGTEGPDSFFGNMQAVNRLYALGSDDHVKGGQLNDWLAAGNGNDKIEGLAGDDRLWGMAGNDQLIGNNGFDTAYFFGLMSTYSISTSNGTVSITDNAAAVDGNDGTDTLNSIELLSFKGGQTLSIASPIILDLDGNGVQTLSASASRAKFDMDGDGRADDTSWIGSGDGFLFLDRDGDGALSGIAEMSFLGDVPGATTDLQGLAAFDSNGDGELSSADSRFADFRIWRDGDGDGAVDRGEILSLSAAGFESLNLSGTANNSTVGMGDVAVVNTGSWTRTDGTQMQFADAAMTFFSAAEHPAYRILEALRQHQLFGKPLGEGVWAELFGDGEDLFGGIPDGPADGLADGGFAKMPRCIYPDRDAANPGDARLLAMMAQDLASFGVARDGPLDIRPWHEAPPRDFYA